MIPSQMSVSALAYLGDAVIELLVRAEIVGREISKSSELNELSREFVTAVAQSAAAQKIIDILTDEENDVYHRGRNCGHLNIPKSASVAEYRRATGLECVFGYLYMSGNTDRMNELFHLAYCDKID